MFCKYCGAKLEEDAMYCGNCGARTDAGGAADGKEARNAGSAVDVEGARNEDGRADAEEAQDESKRADMGADARGTTQGKKKGGARKKILIAVGVLLVIFLGILFYDTDGGEEEEEDTEIALVRQGYLGEFTDATIEEIVQANFDEEDMDLIWSSQVIDGVSLVGFFACPEGETIEDAAVSVLFRICSDETFKVEYYEEEDDEDFEVAEVADLLNGWYVNWYRKNRIDAQESEEETVRKMQELIQNQLNQISGTAVLYGASGDYSGERSELSQVIDDTENLSLNIIELADYYGSHLFDEYMEGAADTLANLGSTELSDYADYTEDELLRELNVPQSLSGYYPSDDSINFMCMDGEVYLIRLDQNHEFDENYTLFGLRVGDLATEAAQQLGFDFTYLDTYETGYGLRDSYLENETGYLLVVDYGTDDVITHIGYTLEDASLMYSDPPESAAGEYNKYGTYAYDNGVDAYLSAEVGFYSDGGEDYIRMQALSYGDRILAEFDGILTWVEGDTYEAVDDGFGTRIRVSFDAFGMWVEVEEAEIEEFSVLGGYYSKMTDINPDEVG